MTGKVVLITGATSGIGKEAAIELARRGATVVIGSRSEPRGNLVLAEVRRRARRDDDGVSVVPLDLARMVSIRRCAELVLERFDRLDVLINNAGSLLSQRRMTEDGFEMSFGVNHLGHFLLTSLLLERLQQSAPSRVITLSSIAHRLAGGMSWSDLQREHGYVGTLAYNESKLANLLFSTELARRLEGTGVTSNAVHPGLVRSGFGVGGDTRGIEQLGMAVVRPFMVTARRGAAPIVELASSPAYESTTGGYFVGGYLSRCSAHQPARTACDPEAASTLWSLSERLVAGR